MTIRFDDRVVIVTGGGNGLGRSHCLGYARRGAKVVVNDLGGAMDGTGVSLTAAESVAEEIRTLGGEAMANGANVINPEEVHTMVDEAMAKWGRIDILINNAGILRVDCFDRLEIDDFRAVIDVHLIGAAICTKAVWNIMREQAYGRVVVTSSSCGLYGAFGQTNYSAAKMGLIGLMYALNLEGKKYDIRVNALAPFAGTRMLDDLVHEDIAKTANPALVTPAVLFLTGEDAPDRTILGAGCGSYTVTRIYESAGKFLGMEDVTPEDIAANWGDIASIKDQDEPMSALEQLAKFVKLAAEAQDGGADNLLHSNEKQWWKPVV